MLDYGSSPWSQYPLYGVSVLLEPKTFALAKIAGCVLAICSRRWVGHFCSGGHGLQYLMLARRLSSDRILACTPSTCKLQTTSAMAQFSASLTSGVPHHRGSSKISIASLLSSDDDAGPSQQHPPRVVVTVSAAPSGSSLQPTTTSQLQQVIRPQPLQRAFPLPQMTSSSSNDNDGHGSRPPTPVNVTPPDVGPASPTRVPRESRPSYFEAQKYFIMHARIVRGRNWTEIENEFARLWPGQLRNQGGLTSVYYRIRKEWGLGDVARMDAESDRRVVLQRAGGFSRDTLQSIGFFG